MFQKLIQVQEQKINSLQTQQSNINKYIHKIRKTIHELKENTHFTQPTNTNIGSFLAISIHHQTIKASIELNEVIILEKTQELLEIKDKLSHESLELEKYKQIIEEQKQQKQLKFKRQEALELDDFLQKSSS
jgi:hypothetical protein